MSYCDNLEEELDRVKTYIKSKKNEMLEKGLEYVYIASNECDFGMYTEITVSVIYANHYINDYDYWSRTREETRRSGATYVSNYLVEELRDISEFEKFEL